MLVLKRKEGQWVEIIHRSGDVIRLRVYDIQAAAGMPSRANLAFDDDARNFEIRRPERVAKGPPAGPPSDDPTGGRDAADFVARELGRMVDPTAFPPDAEEPR